MRPHRHPVTLLVGLLAALAFAPAFADLRVYVSVPPLVPLAGRVGGGTVEVRSLVSPSQDPHTFEPSARQIEALAAAQVFWAVDMPYERAWLPRLRAANPRMVVVDARAALGRPAAEPAAGSVHASHDHSGPDHAHAADPHLWTSPRAVRAMVGPLAEAFAAADPPNGAAYRANATALAAELEGLDAELRALLASLEPRRFVVFHPAWGQFAADYGLEQIAVEQDGKEPAARALAGLATRLRADRTRVIFVQPQTSRRSAEALAREVGARLEVLDPMATDYFGSKRALARALLEAQGR
jgi:zinc transport system substrate-binding protein